MIDHEVRGHPVPEVAEGLCGSCGICEIGAYCADGVCESDCAPSCGGIECLCGIGPLHALAGPGAATGAKRGGVPRPGRAAEPSARHA